MAIKDNINPVNINKDVWFYPVGNKLEFTVYVDGKPKLFDVPKSKLKKYFKINYLTPLNNK